MKNNIPKTNPELLYLAGKAAHGAFLFGAAIPLLQNTQLNINADIDPLVDSIMAHGTGRNDMKIRRETLKSTVQECRVALMLGRDNLKPQFGNFFKAAWMQLGHNGSLEVSSDPAQLLLLLQGYKEFLDANPVHELPTQGFTAVHFGELFAQLQAADVAVDEQDTVVDNLMEDRDTKSETLRKRLRGLAYELGQKIAPLDSRWKSFGLNMPGADETPDGVGAVTAVLVGANTAALKWDAPARAQYYHVFKRVQGVDTEYILVGSPADRDFDLQNLPAGSTIDIVVAAVNNGGEGKRSQAVTIVTH